MSCPAPGETETSFNALHTLSDPDNLAERTVLTLTPYRPPRISGKTLLNSPALIEVKKPSDPRLIPNSGIPHPIVA